MKLLILFGESGAGKTFTAKSWSEKFGYYHLEGDDFLTPDMLQAIAAEKEFTQDMRDDFVQQLIIEIHHALTLHPEGVVVSQALYKEKNRQMIRDAFPFAQMIWIQSDDPTRIRKLKASFEIPLSEHNEHRPKSVRKD